MQVLKFKRKVLCVEWSKRFRGWEIERGPFKTWALTLGAIRVQWILQRWL